MVSRWGYLRRGYGGPALVINHQSSISQGQTAGAGVSPAPALFCHPPYQIGST